MTSMEIRKAMEADKCLTPSRSRSHRPRKNYSNKYTKTLGKLGYNGINANGYFTKFFDYGVVGHCCIGVQAHLIWGGYGKLVPKSGYRWNTNKYARWLKTEPTISGLGKVDWTTDPVRANKAAKAGRLVVTFKGRKGHESFTHTCVLRYIKDGRVHTVDFNVGGKYKGKRINNGVLKSRKLKSYRWGFAILPIPTKTPPYKKGGLYTLQYSMNVRKGHSKTTDIKTRIKSGEKVKALEVWRSPKGIYWIRTAYGWICAKTATRTYLK